MAPYRSTLEDCSERERHVFVTNYEPNILSNTDWVVIFFFFLLSFQLQSHLCFNMFQCDHRQVTTQRSIKHGDVDWQAENPWKLTSGYDPLQERSYTVDRTPYICVTVSFMENPIITIAHKSISILPSMWLCSLLAVNVDGDLADLIKHRVSDRLVNSVLYGSGEDISRNFSWQWTSNHLC